MQDIGGLVLYGGIPFDMGGHFAADLGYGTGGPAAAAQAPPMRV